MMNVDVPHFLFLHFAVTLAFFLWGCRSRNRIQMLSETVLVLALPVFGILTMIGYRVVCSILHLEDQRIQKEDLEEEQLFTGNLDYDGNIVPLNDTFLIDDAKKKREFFTTAIKQNVVTNQEILRMAMNDSDRETAYYAVSLLTTQMEKLENKLFAEEGVLQKEYESEHMEDLETYADTLKEYLSHRKFIDHVTYRQKQGVYLGVLDRLVSLMPERKDFYMEELRQLISAGDYLSAAEVCQNFQEKFPEDEDSYLMYIRLYQAQYDPDKLQEKIAELKASPIKLSVEALRVIRYWDREARYG